MQEFNHSARQRQALKTISEEQFEGHSSDRLEEYGPGKSTLADRINNSDTPVLERALLLSSVFEKRKDSILRNIRSVHTRNLASVTRAEIKDAMQKYENELATIKGAVSNLDEYFPEGNTEVMVAGGLYHIVRDKEAFFGILADEIHQELFAETELFKNVSGVFATRLDKDGKTEVLLVRSAKYGKWQFPGGKAEYVCPNPTTGKTEVVTKRGDVWQFKNGEEAPKDKVVFEKPEECLRREISEELKADVGSAHLNSSGFYTINESRYLIHGFVASNLSVDWEHVNKRGIDKIDWTSNPFTLPDGSPRQMTDQTADVLGRFFPKTPER